MRNLLRASSFISFIWLGAIAQSAWGQPVIRRVAPAAAGMVNLPYQQPDNNGNQWMIYNGGMIQQQGPQPVISQGEVININGQQAQMQGNSAQLDPKTGELILDNLRCNVCRITRRILLNKDDGSVRYVDIFETTNHQAQTVNVQFQTWINFGINNSTTVSDPKKQSALGWVAMTGINRCVVEMYAGKGSKLAPTINNANGNNIIEGGYQLNIPANKQVAIVHFISEVATMDQGQQFILQMNEGKVMASLPVDIRKIVANFPAGTGLVGDQEVLRGDLLDVVELHAGDQIKGTLQAQSYKLSTSYGDIELPTDQVIGLFNVGEFRPRQLIVTSDGQIFGGTLSVSNIDMQLSSGQIIHIPISEVSRAGYRKRPDEAQDWKFDKPLVTLRTGDRVEVERPTTPIEVATRYGTLKLDPATIESITFQSENNPVHQITLTDGSQFAGVVSAPTFAMKLLTVPISKPVQFPISQIVRMQFTTPGEQQDATAPTLALLDEDRLVGSLSGAIRLDTAFDVLQVNAPEIRRLASSAPGSPDVQLELWDNTTVTGQLEDPILHCKTQSGVAIDVPAALLMEYNQPFPMPSAPTADKIKSLVNDLSADDYSQREKAQATLVAMGAPVLSVMRDLRATVPPEAQDRIDAIARALGHADFKFTPGPATKPAE